MTNVQIVLIRGSKYYSSNIYGNTEHYRDKMISVKSENFFENTILSIDTKNILVGRYM